MTRLFIQKATPAELRKDVPPIAAGETCDEQATMAVLYRQGCVAIASSGAMGWLRATTNEPPARDRRTPKHMCNARRTHDRPSVPASRSSAVPRGPEAWPRLSRHSARLIVSILAPNWSAIDATIAASLAAVSAALFDL